MVSLGSVLLLFLSGPQTNLWPLAFVALAPLLLLVRFENVKWKLPVYVSFFAYYLISLEGLRHAHPLMIFPLIALAAYLAVYPVIFVAMMRRVHRSRQPPTATDNGMSIQALLGLALLRCLPIALVAASLWVGGEWVRSHFATGISVLMLGHSIVGMSSPTLIQIADCFGTYGVSFLIMMVNVAVADLIWIAMQRRKPASAPELPNRWQTACAAWRTSVPIAVLALGLAHFYGVKSLAYPTTPSDTTFLLVGRDEQTEYQQDQRRAADIFSDYARQTIAAVERREQPVDVVVWPESMLSGGQAWYIAEENLSVPDDVRNDPQSAEMTADEMRQIIGENRAGFTRRSADLIAAMSGGDPDRALAIIGGCGIIRYGETVQSFSGVLHIGPDGNVEQTYAKNHLVMFGEYIPLIQSIPILKNFVPPGLGLNAGTEPAVFQIGSLDVLPNLCIETAVERVSVKHMRTLLRDRDRALPDVIVTLTNDAWFDHSAVVAHHLRCAQMVAVGCRRPILSSANGGPTAWIDSSGRVVEQLAFDTAGEIFATPRIDNRVSLYVRDGSIPAVVMAIAWMVFFFSMLWQKRPFSRRADR